MVKKCPTCGESNGLRKAIYGMPRFPVDENIFYIAGCTVSGPKVICLLCNWGLDEIGDLFELD